MTDASGEGVYRPESNYHDGVKNSTCYFCHTSGRLEEHHIIPQRFDGPDTESNIVELCQLCHQKLERLYDKQFYEWFGIKDEEGKRKYHRQCNEGGCNNLSKVKINTEYSGVSVAFDRQGVYCRPCASKFAAYLSEEESNLLNVLDDGRSPEQILEEITIEQAHD